MNDARASEPLITDAVEIRSKFRIVGSPVGCLPRATRQTQFCGLPLALMAEEVELLVSKGAARVVETSADRVVACMTEDVKRMLEDWEEASHLGQVMVTNYC